MISIISYQITKRLEHRDKFKLKFPDQFYEMFEIMARSEYGEDESTELIEKAKKDLRESNQKLIDEHR